MKRRRFLHLAVESLIVGSALPFVRTADSVFAAASSTGLLAAGAPAASPLLAVAHGPSPAAIARAAVAALGGMTRFVSRGQKVLVKPNIGWDRRPDQAADTNPEVVAEVVRMCLEAGAASVLVMDNPCNDPRRCYLHSGIAEAARQAGAKVDFFDEDRVRKMDIHGDRIKQWEVHPAVIEADVRINVPIAKHHGLSQVTLGMKNWLGAIGGPRNRLHQEIELSVVDLSAFFRPHLTIIDGVRILTRGGPQGGSLEDVRKLDTVIASADPVAAEARGLVLLGHKPSAFSHVALAASRGLGLATWEAAQERYLEVAAS